MYVTQNRSPVITVRFKYFGDYDNVTIDSDQCDGIEVRGTGRKRNEYDVYTLLEILKV